MPVIVTSLIYFLLLIRRLKRVVIETRTFSSRSYTRTIRRMQQPLEFRQFDRTRVYTEFGLECVCVCLCVCACGSCVLCAMRPGSQCDDSLSITFTFTLFLAYVMRPPTTKPLFAWRSDESNFFMFSCVPKPLCSTILLRKTLFFPAIRIVSLFVDVRFFVSPKFNDKPIVHNHTAADWHYHFAVIVCTDAFRTTSEWNAN